MIKFDIVAWQLDFYNGPAVWMVLDGDYETGNVYDSEDGALLEVAWAKSHGEGRRYRVVKMQVHTLDLARRRWDPASVAERVLERAKDI